MWLQKESLRLKTTSKQTQNAVEMAEKVKDFITEKNNKPFFLYFATSDPHRGGGKDKTQSKN